MREHNSLSLPRSGVNILLYLLCGPAIRNLRRPDRALIEVPFLCPSVVALMVRSQSHHRPDKPTVWGYRLAIELLKRSGNCPFGEDHVIEVAGKRLTRRRII